MSRSSEVGLVYLDSNVFILPALYSGKTPENAKKVLLDMVGGKLRGLTSSLTIDEVVCVLFKKTGDRGLAIDQGERVFSLANLQVVSVDPQSVLRGLGLMKTHPNLKPRDAIHAGVCLNKNLSTIYSDDPDFDPIPNITRIPISIKA